MSGLSPEHDVVCTGTAAHAAGLIITEVGVSTNQLPGVTDHHRMDVGLTAKFCNRLQKKLATLFERSHNQRRLETNTLYWCGCRTSGGLLISFAINHVTVANATFSDLLELSASLGCIGIEARNDLTGALFDGQDPATVRHMLRQSDLRLLALAELKAFNNFSAKTLDEASALISIAKDCGAEGISLIPRNDGVATDPKARAASLKLALTEIKPLLEEAGITGFVEPLGFASSSLRYKHELVAEIEALDASNLYKIVHDTFHHHLAGDTGFYPEHTGIVHVSGVTEQSLGTEQMHDKHRIFVNEQDRLNNIGQLATLRSSGYEGPVSFEVFAPQAQQLERAYSAVNDSIEFITSAITANAA